MMRKRLSIGMRLYLSVLSLFLVFAVAFIVFQQYREKQYKIATMDLRLQGINELVHESISPGGKLVLLHSHMEEMRKEWKDTGLRITIILCDGSVVFDNMRKNHAAMGNHATRPEVAQALKTGKGATVDRNSTTIGHDYFYSATYFPDDGYVVRSALPYNLDMAKSLQTDQHYIWFALGIMILLTFVLYRFTYRIGRNITNLNDFAARIDRGGCVNPNELIGFSDDELGDTAERIVKLYIKLQRTQQEQNVLKRQLTQNVAHELKTPVASIRGYLETILENPNVNDATRKLFLDRCYAQSKRLGTLLNDISTLNRLDDGGGMMMFEEVDIAEIINTIEKESQLELGRKGMDMTCDIPKHILVNGNHNLLYGIFRNLTDNAIAYAGQGTHIKVRAERCANARRYATSAQGTLSWERQRLADSAQEATWHFTFSDNGTGVAPEHLPRLFERFYRIDKGRSRKMGGTGLGLAIVKNSVSVHGGTITVANNPDGGLRFDFTIG